MRTSQPYVEAYDAPPTVSVGERVERDDGWWRAMVVSVISSPSDAIYHNRSHLAPDRAGYA